MTIPICFQFLVYGQDVTETELREEYADVHKIELYFQNYIM